MSYRSTCKKKYKHLHKCTLKKSEYREKARSFGHFIQKEIFLLYSIFVTRQVKIFQDFFVFIVMITGHSSWNAVSHIIRTGGMEVTARLYFCCFSSFSEKNPANKILQIPKKNEPGVETLAWILARALRLPPPCCGRPADGANAVREHEERHKKNTAEEEQDGAQTGPEKWRHRCSKS